MLLYHSHFLPIIFGKSQLLPSTLPGCSRIHLYQNPKIIFILLLLYWHMKWYNHISSSSYISYSYITKIVISKRKKTKIVQCWLSLRTKRTYFLETQKCLDLWVFLLSRFLWVWDWWLISYKQTTIFQVHSLTLLVNMNDWVVTETSQYPKVDIWPAFFPAIHIVWR